MKKIFISLFALATLNATAQTTVNQVVVLNEGYYNWGTGTIDVPVTVGAYYPGTKVYSTFDTIAGAQFASDVIVEGNFLYVASSIGIRKYDKVTKQALANVAVTGVRKMCVWNNQLLVSRGDVGLTNNYFQVYDATNLSFIYELNNVTGPTFTAEGIAVEGDSCFIALNNGFNFPNYTGKVGVVYLPTQTYVREFDLGVLGLNPDYFTIKNGTIYTVNNRDYTNASVSVYDIAGGGLTTTDLLVTGGCGTSVFAASDLIYQVAGESNLKKFSTSSFSTYDSLQINKPIYGLAHDDVNNLLYAGETDFSTYGKIFIYGTTGVLVDSFTVSVSPGNMAIDYNNPTAVNENVAANFDMFPNPAIDILTIKSDKITSYTLCDVLGNKLKSENVKAVSKHVINVSDLKAGVYFVTVNIDSKSFTKKFMKQ